MEPIGRTHQSLRDRVADSIRESIANGFYAPGSRLIERELADQLEVSRVPVREALQTLQAEGFVRLVPRRGAVVNALDAADIEAIFDVREALEVLAARRAAEKAHAVDRTTLERALADAERALANDDKVGFAVANNALHDTLLEATGNSFLTSVLGPLQSRVHWVLRQHDDPEGLHTEHVELVEAVLSGDGDRAAATALEHVRNSRVNALRLVQEQGEDQVAT